MLVLFTPAAAAFTNVGRRSLVTPSPIFRKIASPARTPMNIGSGTLSPVANKDETRASMVEFNAVSFAMRVLLIT